jgi:hypothetical protein
LQTRRAGHQAWQQESRRLKAVGKKQEQIFHLSFAIFHLSLVDSSFKCNSAIRPEVTATAREAPASEPEAVATGQGVNFTSREFQSLIAVTQVLTTTVESLAGRYV